MLLDTRRDVLFERGRQGLPEQVLNVLIELLDVEEEIQTAEFTPAKSRRELQSRRAAAATDIAALLPSLYADADRQEASDLLEIDREPARVAKTTTELIALDQRLRQSDDVGEISEIIEDLARAGDPFALRSAWAVAQKRLRALALAEQGAYRLNGRAFQALNVFEMRIGKQLKTTLPSARKAEVTENARRQKETIRRRVLEACGVVGLAADVQRALLQLQAPEPHRSSIVVGPAFEKPKPKPGERA
jgi:hypothetical protein